MRTQVLIPNTFSESVSKVGHICQFAEPASANTNSNPVGRQGIVVFAVSIKIYAIRNVKLWNYIKLKKYDL